MNSILALILLLLVYLQTLVAQKTSYHLKWVTKDPLLPIFLEKRTHNVDAEYKWYKYPQNVYVDEIDDFKSKYLESQAEDRTILYIIAYDVSSHEQLASYEPRPTSSSSLDDQSVDIFTLAYVESHTIDVRNTPDDLVAHCNVSILMPNNNAHLNAINLKLIERNINLKLGFAHHSGTGQTTSKHDSKHDGKTVRVNNNHNNNKQQRRRRKRSNSGRDDDVVIQKSFIQVNLDIGPILIPKSQLSVRNNPNMTCRLDLLDVEQNAVFDEFKVMKSIDEVVEKLGLGRRKPTQPSSSSYDEKTSKMIDDDAGSLSSSSSSSARIFEGRFIFALLLFIYLFKFFC